MPETVKLLYDLRQAGVDVPLDAISVDECADAICAALKNKMFPKGKRGTVEPILKVENLTHTYSAGTPFQRNAMSILILKYVRENS